MSSLGNVMNRELNPLQVNTTAGEALALMEKTGLAGLPVTDKNHKLLGMVFKLALKAVPAETPLVK